MQARGCITFSKYEPAQRRQDDLLFRTVASILKGSRMVKVIETKEAQLHTSRLAMAFVTAGFLLAEPLAHAESNEGSETTAHRTAKHAKAEKRVLPNDKDAVDPATAADNTGVNKRDRSNTEATVDQQKNDKSDLAMAAKIRRAIMKDQTLSTNAHNVKIIVRDGTVTLKGPVSSKTERAAVEKVALDILGPGRTVANEVSVEP